MASQGHRTRLPRPLLARIRQERLGRAAGFTAWLVDGNVIRSEVDVEFALGGNSERYGYIPRSEIWLEWTGSTADVEATFAHEVIETHLMRQGYSYDQAHEMASAEESTVRAQKR